MVKNSLPKLAAGREARRPRQAVGGPGSARTILVGRAVPLFSSAVSTFGAVLTRIGLVLLALAAIAMLVAWQRRRLARRLAQASGVTCGVLGTLDPLPDRVVVSGRAMPGPAGVFAAPVSEQPCVWYRVKLVENRPGAKNRPRTHLASPRPIRVDDSTGTVEVPAKAMDRFLVDDDINRGLHVNLVEHAFLDFGAHPAALHRLIADGLLPVRKRTAETGYEIHEMRLAPGAPITVLGRPRRSPDGVVIEGEGTSERDHEWLRAGADADQRETAATARVLAYAGGPLLVVGALVQALTWLLR